MVELAVVGAKNSGKTSVIEGLVGYLVGEGFQVATIKHTSHSHRFDKPGKDTYRHRQSGASMTVAVSKGEVAIFAEPDSLEVSQIQNMTHQQVDIWLIEGDRNANRPKILITRLLKDLDGDIPKNVVATFGPERLENIPAHFDEGDYSGLGSFIRKTISARKAELRD